MSLTIIQTTKFNKSVKQLFKRYKNLNKDLELLKEYLYFSPEKSIDLGDKFYKIRLKNSSNNKGKSSGFRIVFFKTNDNEIYLLDIYTKSQIEIIDKNQLIIMAKELGLT